MFWWYVICVILTVTGGLNRASPTLFENDRKMYNPARAHTECLDRRISVLEIIGTATRGGMENSILNFLKYLPKDQFRVTCICPCESLFTKALREIGVEGVYLTPLADDPLWRSIQMALEVIQLHQVDVIHAHMPKSHVLAGIAGSLLRKPVVATVHGMHVTAHELGLTLATGSHLITNCQETFVQALTLGVPPGRVNLFHNGVDTDVFQARASGEKLRQLINLDGQAVLVGFVGRLEHDKGPDLFLRAAGRIHELQPTTHFAVVGNGSMQKELTEMRKKLGLEQHLHFIDWSTDPAEIYPAFDLLAHTSRNDGTSLVLLEAMACGVPVVGMAVGGVREMIENEHTGMLVEPNDWESLGNQVVTLLEQPQLLHSMGRAARTRVEDHFNVQLNTGKTANLLRQLVLGDDSLKGAGSQYQSLPDVGSNGLTNVGTSG